MGLFVKSGSGWTAAKSIFVKSGAGWTSVKKIFIKEDNNLLNASNFIKFRPIKHNYYCEACEKFIKKIIQQANNSV